MKQQLMLAGIIAGLVLFLGGATALYWKGRNAGAAAERPKTVAALAQAAAAAAQARAAQDAGVILDANAGHAQITVKLEGEHRVAIEAAPGADAPLDTGLVAAARHGLCQYQAYAGDPGCTVRPFDPAELPPAGGSGSAAAG